MRSRWLDTLTLTSIFDVDAFPNPSRGLLFREEINVKTTHMSGARRVCGNPLFELNYICSTEYISNDNNR